MRWKELRGKHKKYTEIFAGKNPYEILNLKEGASLQEIKEAYRKLVLVYHPDKSDNFLKNHNQEMFKIILRAYETLLKKTV